MSRTIALVSCVKSKHSGPLPAEELYCSDWFKKASTYAKKSANEWYILSAKYYLLPPHEIIETYDLTLKGMKVAEKRIWANTVFQQLAPKINPEDQVIVLAGKDYRKYLLQPIQDLGCNVEIPMEGLLQGEQLRWLKQRLEDSK